MEEVFRHPVFVEPIGLGIGPDRLDADRLRSDLVVGSVQTEESEGVPDVPEAFAQLGIGVGTFLLRFLAESLALLLKPLRLLVSAMPFDVPPQEGDQFPA